MADVLQQDLISYDPLSEATRKERRALLGFSLLGSALVLVPLVPTKIAVFGLEFADINRKAFVLLYALLIAYYLLAFLIYSFTDLVAWRRGETIRFFAYQRAEAANAPPAPPVLEPFQSATVYYKNAPPVGQPFAVDSPAYRGLAAWNTARTASRLRAFFEFVLPIGVSGVALYLLVTYAVRL